MRPTCINYGCNESVTYSRQNKDGSYRWRIHCSHCQKASYGAHAHAFGVKPFKTGKCSNTDGHLGFDCMIKWTKVPDWAKGMTEIDHRDGDATNNSVENLDELCPICHKLKGQLNGDFNNQKSNLSSAQPLGFKSKKSSRHMFENWFSYDA